MKNRRAFLAAAAAGVAASTLLAAEDGESLPGRTKNTKFAVNVEMWWTKLPFLKRFEEAAKLGFPAIEMWPWEQRGDKVTVEQVAEITKRLNLEVAQFTAWGFKPGMNEPKNHAAFVDTVGRSCGAAKKLDCKLMTVVGGDDVPGM